MGLSIIIAIIFTTGSLAATDIDSANNTLSQDLASTDENTTDTSNDTQEVLSDEEQASDNTSTSAIETIYSNDNDTISSNKTISTDSNQKTTTNTPVSITTTANNSITLKTVIKTSDGTYVDEGTVAFKINGKTVGYGEVSNGVATYVYNMPSNMKSPVYTITAVYGATSQYKSSTGTTNLYLNNVTNTNIKVTSISSQVGKTVTLKATLTTTNGSYVKNGTVAFKINGITIGYSEVSNGGVKLTYTIPSTWTDSTYNITVVYGATGQYKSSTGTGKLYLTYEEPDLTVSDVTTSSGKTVTLKASVTDDNTSISNGTVAFKINGKTVGYSDVSSGSANINLSVPTSWTDSEYTITAVYGQNGKYLKTSSNATLTVKKNTTTTVGSTTSYAGKTITLKATVKDSNSKSVTSGKVVFKINGKTVGTATVSNGVATISYKIPSSWSDSSYKISASYAGNSYYTSSSDTSTLYLKNVTQTSTKVTSITSTNGKTITLKATIKESDGYAKTGTVVFKINGKTVGTAT
ncbi:MAG: Ig-like domain repeat protein, partial [Methanosphaera sp.]|nr:Ig-like domain repeat protein [Methanosphaera sp.]